MEFVYNKVIRMLDNLSYLIETNNKEKLNYFINYYRSYYVSKRDKAKIKQEKLF